MFVIREPRTEEIDHFFLSDPALCFLGLSDNELYLLHKEQKYTNIAGNEIWGLYEDDKLILLITCSLFTRDAVTISLYLASSYHKTGKFRAAAEFLKAHYIDNTNYNKVLMMSPSTCPHVHRAAEAVGFKLEGTLTKTITWRQELVDLLIYGWTIKRNK